MYVLLWSGVQTILNGVILLKMIGGGTGKQSEFRGSNGNSDVGGGGTLAGVNKERIESRSCFGGGSGYSELGGGKFHLPPPPPPPPPLFKNGTAHMEYTVLPRIQHTLYTPQH